MTRLLVGLSRPARAITPTAAMILALAWGLHGAPPIADRLVQRMHLGTSSELIAWGKIPDEELRAGTTQFNVFVIILVAVAGATLLAVAIDRLLQRVSRAPALPWVFRAGLVVAAAVQVGKISSFALTLAAVVALWTVSLLAPHLGAGGAKRGATPRPSLLVAALSVEWLSFGWATALTLHPLFGASSYLLAIAGGILGASRAASQPAERAVADVYGYAPFLAAPLIGLIRQPSPYLPLWMLAGALVWRWVIERRGWHRRWSFPTWMASVGAPFALGSILFLPERFRELPSISHNMHEGQHMGWVNSVLFGKFMFADASVIYGPLREYVLALFCVMTGVTAEHLRLAHVAVNLVGLGFAMAASWRVVRGRFWLQLVFLGLLLAHSQLAFMVTYRDQLSFGWVDLARLGLPAFALVGALTVVTEDTSAPRGTGRFSLRSRRLATWGLLAGLSVLYSHDFGTCAVGSVGLALGADAVVRRKGPLAERFRTAFRDGGAFTAGVLAPIALLVIIYVIAGRGPKLVHAVLWVSLLASGSWSGVTYPVTQHTFDSKDTIVRGMTTYDGVVIDFLAPLLVCVVGLSVVLGGAFMRRWSKRTTVIFALLLFSVTGYRHGLLHTDLFHLRSCGAPSLLLLVALIADAATWTIRTPLRADRGLPIGAAISGFVLVAWTICGDQLAPIHKRVDEIGNGTEAPSVGPPYQYADIPRAGDLNVPPGDQAVIRYVLKTTSHRDPVYSARDFVDGAEYNFMTARRNPTPWDVPAELLTHADQARAYEIFRTDPPTIILGDYNVLGDDTRREIAAHWQVVSVPGGSMTVRRYHPPE